MEIPACGKAMVQGAECVAPIGRRVDREQLLLLGVRVGRGTEEGLIAVVAREQERQARNTQSTDATDGS